MKFLHALRIRNAFKYGVLGVIIFTIIAYILSFLIQSMHSFWHPLLFWIDAMHPIIGPLLSYCAAFMLTLVGIYITGVVLTIRIGNEALAKQVLAKVPILSIGWEIFEKISETIHKFGDRPFVFMRDWPSAGFHAIGVITGKQIFREYITKETVWEKAYPRVCILTSLNFGSAFLVFPEKEKLTCATTDAHLIMKMIVLGGIIGPEYIELKEASDQSNLASYYAV